MIEPIGTYWGIGLRNGDTYMVCREIAEAVIQALDANAGGLIEVVILAGNRVWIQLDSISEVYESIPETRERHREIQAQLKAEASAFNISHPDYNDD